jgi:plastocyanin
MSQLRIRRLTSASIGLSVVLAACNVAGAPTESITPSVSAGPSAGMSPGATDAAGAALTKRGFPADCPELSASFDLLNTATYQVFAEQISRDEQGQATLVHAFLGTAWAVGDRFLATNAHVAEIFPQSAAQGVQLSRAIAVQSGTGMVVRLVRGYIHPDYDGATLGTPDVGLFESEQILPATLPLAPADSILGLGDEIQIVGFPGDVDLVITVVPGETVPQATSLTGRVTARRSRDQSEAVTPATLDVYQHQAPTTPGTSGSSMFHCGLVAGINNAGTNRFVLTPDPAGGDQFIIDRQSAASNNFAIHVRYIHQIIERLGGGTLQGLELPVTAAAAPPGGGGGGGGPGGGASATVDIVDLAFQPPEIAVAAGGTVTWRNTGSAPHTATAEDGSFDAGTVQSGASASVTFPAAGQFAYLCAIHPQQMRGLVTVQPGGPPSAQPVPIAGSYTGAVMDPAAQHQLTFTIGENGIIEGTSSWPESGQFVLAGGADADGRFVMADNAPERVGFRRGIYQGAIAPDGSVAGLYFEQTQEQTSWSFTAQRGQ